MGAISKYKPPGAYIRRGDLTEGFLRYDFGGLIFGGAHTRRGLFSEFYGIALSLSESKKSINCLTVNWQVRISRSKVNLSVVLKFSTGLQI